MYQKKMFKNTIEKDFDGALSGFMNQIIIFLKQNCNKLDKFSKTDIVYIIIFWYLKLHIHKYYII